MAPDDPPDVSDAPTARAGGKLRLEDNDVERVRASIASIAVEDTFDGRFEILAEAGSGGMGRVYEAIDRDSGGRVAIKVITGLPSPNERARFTAEAEILERLTHPAIVRYVRHGMTTRGEPYLAMGWLVGENLSKRLEPGALSIA